VIRTKKEKKIPVIKYRST